MRTQLSVLALAPLVLALSSCVYSTDPGSGSYGSSRASAGYSYGSYGLPWGVGRGYRPGYCNTCRSYNCRGHYDHRDRYDHDRHDSHGQKKSSSDLKHREGSYRIASGSTGSKSKPTGYHSPEWFRSRGYDTSRLRLEDERGNTYRSGNSSSKSSSSSSRSSSGGSSSGSGSKKKSSSSSSKSSSSKSKSSGGSSKGNLNSRNPHLQQRGITSSKSSSSKSSGGKSSKKK